MYPRQRSQDSAQQPRYPNPVNNNNNNNNKTYHYYDSLEKQKHHLSNEQLMAGLDKFVRRYESQFCSRIMSLT